MFFALVASIIILILLNKCREEGEDVFRVAAILPLTGVASETGESAKNGLELCADKWNAIGGILGKKVVIDYYDSKAESKQGAIIANKISTINVPRLVITTVSGVALTAQPYFEENKIIQICLVSTEKLFETSPKYTIRAYFSTPDICKFLLDNYKSKFGKNKISIIYANTDQGIAFKESILNYSPKMDIQLEKQIVIDESEFDFKNIIRKANFKDDDVVFLAARYSALGRMVKQLRESGFKGKIVSDIQMTTNDALKVIGDEKKDCYYVAIQKNETMRDISQNYHDNYDSSMDENAMVFYNALDVIFDFVETRKEFKSEDFTEKINEFTSNICVENISFGENQMVFPFKIYKLK